MKLNRFAETILFGISLEEKLLHLELELPDSAGEMTLVPALERAPTFPGRPTELATPGKARFPSLHRLHEPVVRGEVLHFFANHELLAMELMALVLLRFPEAPSAFRLGLAQTIQEEQNHLRLYIERMKELGVSLGDLPVSDYFWKSMSGITSPMEFVVQMSLTFEQANLDFSLFFKNAIEKVGDLKTAAILERVYREEIGHVKHGLSWFNRWRNHPEKETDWDAYLRHLPSPMTPRRAKGFEFFADGRREAGLSETFIQNLRIYSGSKGRPPILWSYNPHCDSEIARGRPGFTPTQGSQKLTLDLECTPAFLSLNTDLVLVKECPRSEWIESLQQAGFETPEFGKADSDLIHVVRAPKIGGMQPWGWSPDTLDAFRPLRSRLVSVDGGNASWCAQLLESESFAQTGIGKLFSKAWSVAFLASWLKNHPEIPAFAGNEEEIGMTLRTSEAILKRTTEILSEGRPAALKAPYGTSGMQLKTIRSHDELEGPTQGWIRNILASQGELIVEPWLNKICDLSIQLTVEDERIRIHGIRRFITGNRNEYRGTFLGGRFPGFETEHLRFLHSVLDPWHGFIQDLGLCLQKEGYRGPAGVDALLWKDVDGNLRLKPLVELNPRWTMGQVALRLETHLAPGVQGIWMFLPVREVLKRGYSDAQDFAKTLTKKYPTRKVQAGGGMRIENGVVFTNDPGRAREVLTVLSTLPNPDLFLDIRKSESISPNQN